ELAKLILFEQKPNIEFIGERWRSSLEDPPTWRDFTNEAGLLINYLQSELRVTDVFRPVLDSQSLDNIAIYSHTSMAALTTLVTQLDNLITMTRTHYGDLARTFNAASLGIRDHIRDYTQYIEEKTRNFIGREFVFNAINQFIQDNPRGYF